MEEEELSQNMVIQQELEKERQRVNQQLEEKQFHRRDDPEPEAGNS